MRTTFIALATLLLTQAFTPTSRACSPPSQTAPTIYTLESEGGDYVLAVVEGPERYSSFGYVATEADREILDRYAAPGIYRRHGPFGHPLWGLDIVPSYFPKSSILAFFEEDGHVYLIEDSHDPFVIWKDGEVVDELGDREFADLFGMPWVFSDSCGSGRPYEAEVITRASRRVIRITTGEGAEFHYSATTGELIEEKRPNTLETDSATGGENLIAQYVVGWSAYSEARAAEALVRDFGQRLSPIAVESCNYFIGKGEMETSSTRWIVRRGWFPAGPGLAALKTDIPFAPRLRHEYEGRVDLYRVPAGKAGKALCVDGFSLSDATPNWLSSQLGSAGAERETAKFRRQLEGPAVLAVTTWPTPKDSDWADEDTGGLGSATLWADIDGDWRIVAFVSFVLPHKD